MTLPSPFEPSDDYSTLRRRFYGRFITVQNNIEAEVREILHRGSKDADKEIRRLMINPDWETGVRTAQIRMAKNEIHNVLKDMFNEVIPVITKGHRAVAQSAIEALADTDRKYLKEVLRDSGTNAVDQLIRSQKHSAMLSVTHAISRITKSRQPLSSRVYKTRALANGWIDRTLTSSIMRGDSAQQIAYAIRGNIRPDTPGGVSYAAMRLARTEINNAFHATTITYSQDRPWIESMAWNLSATHIPAQTGVHIEICDIYAAKTWHVDNVPPKPHPQCRCFVTPKLIPFEVFLQQLKAGQYRDWKENAA